MPAAGYPFHPLRVRGIDRDNPLRAARALLLAAGAAGRARRILREVGADAVLGGGGYVAGPVGLAARTAGLPLVLSEADSHLGVANRMLAPFARRVCLAFPLEGREGKRYLVTGRPVPAATGHADRHAARERFGIPAEHQCLLVFGGSLGARRLNHAAIDAFGEAAPCVVLHRLRAARRGRVARPPGGARLALPLPPRGVYRAVRGRARGGRPRGRAGGRLGARGGGGRPAVGARSLPARHRRPSDAERALHGAGRRRRRGARRRARRPAPRARGGRAARSPAAHGRAGKRGARRCAARRRRADRRRAAGGGARGAGRA